VRKCLMLALVVLLACGFSSVLPACSAQDEPNQTALSSASSTLMATAEAEPMAMPATAALPASLAASSPALPAAPSNPEEPRKIGVGVKISMLGIGGEAAVALTKRINVRGGFNLFSYSTTFNNDGIGYGAKLAFRSGEAHLDFFPFAGGFHLSPGLLLYNDNHIDANVNVGSGQSFTLGGVSYTSNPTNPVMGTASLGFNKVAPTFLIGFGNLIPRNRRRFSFTGDFGIAYTGAPKAAMTLAGSVCTSAIVGGSPVSSCVDAANDPTVQANVQSEVAKVNHDVSFIKIYPIASFGFAVNF
jgi:hypothetical protein